MIELWPEECNYTSNNDNNEAPKVRTLSAIKHYLAITIFQKNKQSVSYF